LIISAHVLCYIIVSCNYRNAKFFAHNGRWLKNGEKRCKYRDHYNLCKFNIFFTSHRRFNQTNIAIIRFFFLSSHWCPCKIQRFCLVKSHFLLSNSQRAVWEDCPEKCLVIYWWHKLSIYFYSSRTQCYRRRSVAKEFFTFLYYFFIFRFAIIRKELMKDYC
jgi:hypothetical protein